MSLLIQKIEAGLAAQVKQHLDAGGTEITVASMGGDLVEAMNVSKVIAESGKDVTCRVLANCGSAANTILLACKNRVCYSDSMFMTHRPQISATGTVDQVVASANAGAMAEQSLKASFGAHADALLGDSERWLTADEAKQYGLVTEVLATQAPADQQQILNMVKSLRVGSNVVPFNTTGDPVKVDDTPPSTQVFNQTTLGTQMQTVALGNDARAKARHTQIVDALASKMSANVVKSDFNIYHSKSCTEIRDEVLASTDDFPKLLGEAGDKVLVNGFESAPEAWRTFATEVPVKNFHEVQLGSFSEFDDLDDLDEGQEIKVGSLGENVQTAKLGTSGKLLYVSRQMIVNDQLGEFGRLAERMSRSAARKVGDAIADFVKKDSNLSDGRPLFNATNQIDTSPSSSALNTLRSLMAKVKINNIVTNSRPVWAWCSVNLEGVIRAILASELSVLENLEHQTNMANEAGGLVEPANVLGDPRLADTAWHLISRDGVAYCYLESAGATPMLDSERTFTVDGYGFRVLHDYAIVPTSRAGIARGNE